MKATQEDLQTDLKALLTEFERRKKGATFFEEFPGLLMKNLLVTASQNSLSFKFMDDEGKPLFHSNFDLFLTPPFDKSEKGKVKLNVPSFNFDPENPRGELQRLEMVQKVLDKWDEVSEWALHNATMMHKLQQDAFNVMMKLSK